MKRPDDYASRESSRRRAYREAYDSPEARAWIDGLSPAVKSRAAAMGLLKPYLDTVPGDHGLDNLPTSLEPRRDGSYDDGLTAKPIRQRLATAWQHPAWRRLLGDDETHHAEMLRAFLVRSGHPRRCWACLCHLLGHGTCEFHAHQLGMSKQAFHYHVRKLAKQLGLPLQN